MTLRFRDKRQIERRKRAIRTTIGFTVFLILTLLGAFVWPGQLLHRLGRPLWKAQNTVSDAVENSSYVVRTKASVFRENEALKQENADLKVAMIDYQILKNENDQLKELFGRFPTPYTFILAPILTRPSRSPYDTIIIDGGSNTSIEEGDHVYANGDIPLGEVSKVYATTSLVMLYSNPGQTTEAVLEGSNATVELIGRGGGNFEMSVPVELSTEKGAYVVFPNLKSEIVAILEEVISTPTDPIKRIILRSPINIQNLKWVQVRKN